MDATTLSSSQSLNNNLDTFLQQVSIDYADIEFVTSDKSKWDPKTNKIFYNSSQPRVIWSILHELGHMIAEHKTYKSDLDLLMKESEAWEKAKKLAKKYKIKIDDDYIENCKDSYRNWLHRRSTCPDCEQTGIQDEEGIYSCLNCGSKWKVSKARFHRIYRARTKNPV